MKVYKNGRKKIVNDADIHCLVLNYSKKGTIEWLNIHGLINGTYKLNSGWEYVREATSEEEIEFTELTKNFDVCLKKEFILSEWNNI